VRFFGTSVTVCQCTRRHIAEETNRFILLFADHIKVTRFLYPAILEALIV